MHLQEDSKMAESIDGTVSLVKVIQLGTVPFQGGNMPM